MEVALFLLSVLLVRKVITVAGAIDAVTISPMRGAFTGCGRP